MDKLTFKLPAGVWEWWFRDKETLEPLSSITRMCLVENVTEMSFIVPEELKGNKNVVIKIQRTRGW